MSTLPFHLPRDPLRRWKKSYMSTIVAVLALLLGPAGLHKRGAAVTFTVNSSADEVDVAPGDGVCNTGSACTLRAAVMEANALPGADSIVLPDGDYVFSIPGNDDAAATGDLDITSEVAINGTAANYVTIDASALDRVFDVRPSGNLSLTGVSVVGGWDIAGTGGGIRNEGALTLVRAEVRDNRADTDTVSPSLGGGVYSTGALTVRESSIWDNSAGGTIPWASGGGVYATSGTFTNVAIFGNTLPPPWGFTGGGGIASAAPGGLTLRNCTIADNSGGHEGGGVIVLSGAPPAVRNSIIAGNTAMSATPDCNQIESQGYNLIQDPTSCAITGDLTGVQTGVNPIFGGPVTVASGVEVVVPDESGPAVDAGNPAAPGSGGAACEERDIGGYPRALSARCDLGAYESGHCWPVPLSERLPGLCRGPTSPPKGLLALQDKPDDRRDSLVWRWLKGQSTDDTLFGVGLSSWEICIYDDTGLVLEAFLPGGGTCGTKPCWTDLPTGLRYKNGARTPDGIGAMRMRAGIDGKASISATGKGAALRFLPPPWSSGIKAEAISGGGCWLASYPSPIANRAGFFKARP